jgi:phage host-nuclease inhibitor protein Gam
LSYVFAADNRAAAASFEKLYDDIASGKPSSVIDTHLVKKDGTPAWQLFQQNVGQNYIVGDILSDMRKIENMFNTAIGIPNANTDKKERLISDEVQANNNETSTLCELWLDELQKTCEKTREMFGIEICVDWRVKPETVQEPEKKTGGDEK